MAKRHFLCSSYGRKVEGSWAESLCGLLSALDYGFALEVPGIGAENAHL